MLAYDIFRWVVTVVFALFGLLGWWIIIMNFWSVYVWFARRERHSSIPLFGGIFAFVGMLGCPLPQIQKFFWIPLVVDIGYFLLSTIFGLTIAFFARRKRDDA
ncbi:MAG: hypothetical protein ABSH14_09040 [Verrucomicrobiia bacterium]|jgi:hypothetical protein